MTSAPLLQLRNLHVGFSVRKEILPAVRGVDLTMYPGQTVAVVGESGSGKSTTAHAINRLLADNGRITDGEILFEGRDVVTMKKSEIIALRGRDIGFVPQDPMSNLNPLTRVGKQIKEALEANGIAKGKAADKRVTELLEEAGLPDAERRARMFPHEYSGGMRQRALIAMGLAARPKLLIADEPTSALDVTVQKQILDHMEGLTRELSTAVLLITHDLGLAAERADHLVVMYQGQVVESGPALEIMQDPQHAYTKRLVTAAPSLASQRLSSLRARAEVREHAQEVVSESEQVAEGGDDVIGASGLVKEFLLPGPPWNREKLRAVDGVSFSLERGTTTAIVGESGSGKSTLARMVLGLLEPTEGVVELDGRDVRSAKSREENLALRRQMQPIFQNPYAALDPKYSIYRAVEEPLKLHQVGSSRERESRIRDLLDKVSLPSEVLGRYPHELSGGQRQRVAIARALALDPEVIVCDEAVSALDVLVQAQILNLLNDLQAEMGLSYLFITHDLAVVRQIADDVLVMQDGAVVEQASVAEVFENPREGYTRRLLDAIPGGKIPLGTGESGRQEG